MTKAELASHAEAYEVFANAAGRARGQQDWDGMLRAAVDSLVHVDGMMRYCEKYEEEEFTSVGTIDLIFQYGPAVLAGDAIGAVAEVLKEKKRIDRSAASDLATMLWVAEKKLKDCCRIWELVEEREPVLQADLDDLLGGDQAYLRGLAERMAEVGVLKREPSGNSYLLSFQTSFDRAVEGMCSACGRRHRVRKELLLDELGCLSCGVNGSFVICGE